MEIKSFEPYHIGTKLQPHVDLDILASKLRKALKEKEYEGTEKPVVELPIKIEPPREILGVKKEVRVELNLPATALNTIGEKPENVIEVFREVNSLLPELNYDLEATVVFYEIIANIIIESTKPPREMINKALKIDLRPLNGMGKVVVDSFRIINVSPTERQGAIRMIVAPNPSNPNTMFLVRLVYRAPKKEGIELFHKKLQSKVLKVIQSLE